MKKVFKIVGKVLLALAITLCVLVAARQNQKFESHTPTIMASTDSAIIARGMQIVTGAGHCADCHGAVGMEDQVQKGLFVNLSVMVHNIRYTFDHF